jgi:hypothetical protein
MHSQLTLHPCVALSPGGFIPAIKVVNAKGEHVRTYAPQGEAVEYRTFTRKAVALLEAWVIARRIVSDRPDHFCVN